MEAYYDRGGVLLFVMALSIQVSRSFWRFCSPSSPPLLPRLFSLPLLFLPISIISYYCSSLNVLSDSLSACVSGCLSVSLSVRLYVRQFVCLSFSFSQLTLIVTCLWILSLTSLLSLVIIPYYFMQALPHITPTHIPCPLSHTQNPYPIPYHISCPPHPWHIPPLTLPIFARTPTPPSHRFPQSSAIISIPLTPTFTSHSPLLPSLHMSPSFLALILLQLYF